MSGGRCVEECLVYADFFSLSPLPSPAIQDWTTSQYDSPDSVVRRHAHESGSGSKASSSSLPGLSGGVGRGVDIGGRGGGGRGGGGGATLTASQRAALAKQTVIRPSEPERAARPCGICREPFEGEFREEEEEWVWANAVEVEGVVSGLAMFLASCHLALSFGRFPYCVHVTDWDVMLALTVLPRDVLP